VCVLGLSAVPGAARPGFTFRELPRYPSLHRDLAFIVGEGIAAGEVRDALLDAAGVLADACELFDVYRGSGLPEGTKSLAFGLDLRAPDRTLTDEEATPVVATIAEHLRERFGATLRAG